MLHDRAVVLEVSSADGGTYTFARARADESYREGAGDAYELVLHQNDRAQRSRSGRRGALAGAVLSAVVLGAVCFALFARSPAPDGLSPTRGDLWCPVLFCFAPLGALLGYAIGRGSRPALAAGFEASFGGTVLIDGVDVGALVRVESDVPSCSVLVVTERREVRIALGTEQDAVVLADALSQTLLSRAQAPAT